MDALTFASAETEGLVEADMRKISHCSTYPNVDDFANVFPLRPLRKAPGDQLTGMNTQ